MFVKIKKIENSLKDPGNLNKIIVDMFVKINKNQSYAKRSKKS